MLHSILWRLAWLCKLPSLHTCANLIKQQITVRFRDPVQVGPKYLAICDELDVPPAQHLSSIVQLAIFASSTSKPAPPKACQLARVPLAPRQPLGDNTAATANGARSASAAIDSTHQPASMHSAPSGNDGGGKGSGRAERAAARSSGGAAVQAKRSRSPSAETCTLQRAASANGPKVSCQSIAPADLQVQVVCNETEGTLYPATGRVIAAGKHMTATQFEQFAGAGSAKKWKASLRLVPGQVEACPIGAALRDACCTMRNGLVYTTCGNAARWEDLPMSTMFLVLQARLRCKLASGWISMAGSRLRRG
jgi:SAND domain